MQKIVIVLSMLILASCVPAPQPVAVDVSPIKTAEVIIIQDKTTKHDLLSVLGAPTDLHSDSMRWYRSTNPREYFDVKYVQHDGTTFGFCVGMRSDCKSSITVYYKQDKDSSIDIVRNMTY